ncbi:efflux RND transporter periplasmic adaptor subunit [Marinobacter halophilus]|uniref:Efflux RND transporter periplasmic adaptor subunit n=1 Tax=Marinobacter halophilus TaxID=1323740 RepID=A0A2T1K9T3_9GAMM|nr:efflux RND transporter periplasmic adaptor subunit [Marinobacter halophilus]PSF06885.1 efflux RND transporter periplasmic adaptor subunit [Marinobacter halophilus]GGC76330.1 hemolysin D [Marinobacter halophilus]
MTKAKLGSLGLSLLVLVLLVIWMATGDVKIASNQAPDEPRPQDRELTRVEVETLQATNYQPTIKLQGQLEPWQVVTVSARTAGIVDQMKVQLGQQVRAGQELLTLSVDGRDAVVERWRARIRKLEADLAAARQLRARNLAAETEILGLQSELAAARAESAAAELAVQHLAPAAPFDAVVNRREVDQGTLVQVGTPLLELVQIDRLKAIGRVPQQTVKGVQPGQAVEVNLLDGTRLAGVISFVASAADPETRSFAVEIVVENPDQKRAAGGSANLNIQLPEQDAIFISPAYLSLDDDGRPGVKYVDDNDQVVFQNVMLLSVSTNGAWVSGLPDEIRLITRGGGFVAEGETVEPVDRSDQRG